MIPPLVSYGCVGLEQVDGGQCHSRQSPINVNRLVIEMVANGANVNVDHLDVVELVDVELLVEMSNQGTCDSRVL